MILSRLRPLQHTTHLTVRPVFAIAVSLRRVFPTPTFFSIPSIPIFFVAIWAFLLLLPSFFITQPAEPIFIAMLFSIAIAVLSIFSISTPSILASISLFLFTFLFFMRPPSSFFPFLAIFVSLPTAAVFFHSPSWAPLLPWVFASPSSLLRTASVSLDSPPSSPPPSWFHYSPYSRLPPALLLLLFSSFLPWSRTQLSSLLQISQVSHCCHSTCLAMTWSY